MTTKATSPTTRKQAEDELGKYRQHLEELVKERTVELKKVIEQLQEEITERKQAEEALQESEEKFRSIFQSATDCIMHLDLSGKILDVNEKAVQMYGGSKEELLGKHFASIGVFSSEYRPILNSNFARIISGKESRLTLRIRNKKGEERDLECSADIIKIGNKLSGVTVIARDITERKQAEQALRESEARLAKAQQIAHLGNFDWNVKDNTSYLSDEYYRIFGLSPREVGFTYEKFISHVHPDDREFVKRATEESFYQNAPHSIDYRIILPDGSERTVHSDAEVTFDEAGEPIRMVGIIQDITERKRAGEALRESEENFRNSLDSSPLGIRIITAVGETIYANRAILDIYGYSSIEEFKSIPAVERHTLKSYAERQERVRKRGAGEPVPDYFEQSIIRKNGEVRDLEVFHREVLWGGEKQFQLIYRDITEHKHMEEELRGINQLFSGVLLNAPVCVSRIDENGIFTQSLGSGLKEWGLKEGQLVGANVFEVAPHLADKIRKVLSGDKVEFVDEVTYKGKPIYFHNYLFPDKVLGKGILNIAINITERKQAEEKLQRSHEQLRSLSAYLQYVGEEVKVLLTPLQKRFARSGLRDFDDREAFELFMSLCPYRTEMMPKLGQRCLTEFKNIRELISASPKELQQAGLAPECMFYIRLLREIPSEVLKQKILEKPVYNSSKEIFDYLYCSMRDLEKEVLKVTYLDKRDQIIDTVDLFEGTLDSIPIRPREIMESAIEHNASALIFTHNHPTGDPTPSKTDKQFTRDLVFVGMVMQIKVLDHIIIGEDIYFSFADDGLIEKYEDEFLNMKIKALIDTGVQYLKS